MKLEPARWRALSELLDHALDLPASARDGWLATLEGEAATLRPLLADLLARDARAETGDFIDTLPRIDDGPLPSQAGLVAGALIGPYRLTRELGRGGMGEVWLAERADGLVRRPVALKLPLLAMSRGALAERLARERDVLASLAHANIARLYDAGFADGQPYLALEYVDGVPITRYADAHGLDLRARLALFDQVLRAVAHAHANLVLHRDLKPSNILVTPAGEVKLLDFGIAKLLTDGQAQETELTRVAGAALTLDYASPEHITGASLTTAADVYSLGVVLYELCTGARPYRLRRASRGELEEAILSRDEVPPRQAPLTDAIARARGTTVPRLRKALGGDLATIVGKALRKDPANRYATADALAEDLRRCVAGEPVSARPDSRGYRLRKFVARHRIGFATASGVAVALLGATLFSYWQAQAAREHARTAEREAARAQAVQGFLLDIFRVNSDNQPDPLRARQTTARELLDIGAARIGERLKDTPDVEAEVADTLSDMYSQLGLDAEAGAMTRRRIEALKRTHGARDRVVADALLVYAGTLFGTKEQAQGAAALAEAKDILDALHDQSPVRGRLLVESARFAMYQSIPRMLDNAEAAVRFYRESYPGDEMRITALRLAGRARYWSGDYGGSAAAFEEALASAQEIATRLTLLVELADTQARRGDIAAAEARLREALELSHARNGELHVDTLHVETRLGALLHATGRRAEGRQWLASALAKLGRGPGTDTPNVIDPVHRNYAAGLLNDGRVEEALDRADADVASIRARGAEGLPFAGVLRLSALADATLGRHAEAQRALDEALKVSNAAGGMGAGVAGNLLTLDQASLQLARGDAAAALATLAHVTPPRDAATMPFVSDTTLASILSARALLMQGRVDDARAAAQRARDAIAAAPVPAYFPVLEAEAALRLGQAQQRLGDLAGARASLERAVALRRENDDPDWSPWLAESEVALADCLLDLHDAAQARTLLQSAARIQSRHPALAAGLREPLARATARTLRLAARRS